MIPESQHLDSVMSEKFFSRTIAYQSVLVVMTAAIQLDRQLRSRAVEVEYVRLERMLPTKFVTYKIPIPQAAPEHAFPLRWMLAQITSATHKTI
jgi:hypothetical protein